MFAVLMAGTSAYHQKILKAIVSEDRIFPTESTLVVQDTTFRTVLKAATQCAQLDWCRCVCKLPSNVFVLTSLIVSAGITDPAPGVPLQCHTKRQKSYPLQPATGVTITGIMHKASLPDRVIGNLIDGVYGLYLNDCFLGIDLNNIPYIIINLGEIKSFNAVTIILQPTGDISYFFGGSKVLVSNISSTQFEDYILVEAKPDLVPEHSMEVVYTRGITLWGQYVALVMGEERTEMQICHIEIN